MEPHHRQCPLSGGRQDLGKRDGAEMLDLEYVTAFSFHSRQICRLDALDQRTKHDLSVDVFYSSRVLIALKLIVKVLESLAFEEEVVTKFYGQRMPRNTKVVELASQGNDVTFLVVAVDVEFAIFPGVIL